MKYNDSLIKTKEVILKPSKMRNANNMPFRVKEVGFCRNRDLSLDSAKNPTDGLFLFTLTGLCELTRRHRSSIIHPDQLVIHQMNIPVSFKQKGTEEWYYYYLILGGNSTKGIAKTMKGRKSVFDVFPPVRLVTLFKSLMETEYNDSLENCFKASLIIHSMINLVHEYAYDVKDVQSPLSTKQIAVNRVTEYISAHYAEQISIDSLYREVGFSKYYLCKIFKDATGETIHSYINKYRISKAAALLKNSDLSAVQVSRLVGFTSPVTFHRVFKSVTGKTPKEL